MRNTGIFSIILLSLLVTACQSSSGISRADRSVFQSTDN